MKKQKKWLFELIDEGIIRRGEVYPDSGVFCSVRFGLGKEKFKEHRTERAAVTFMRQLGYKRVIPARKKHRSLEEANTIRRKAAISRLKHWFLERNEFLNMTMIAKKMKIPGDKMELWLKGKLIEFSEKEYKQLMKMRNFIKS